MGFTYHQGHLYCEKLRVNDIRSQVGCSPFYLYSKQEIIHNYRKYEFALTDLTAVISYAVKANANITILKLLHSLGSWVTLVSGNEILFANAAGFTPQQMIFNGNGKTMPELKLALDLGVMVNIDSKFDLEHISSAAQESKVTANVLLRIKPDITVDVHPYIATGLRESKFGIPVGDIETMVNQIRSRPFLNLLGFHCHLGSTVVNLGAFEQTMGLLARKFRHYHQKEYPLKYLNIGGGLAIDYRRDGRTIPTPADQVSSIAGMLPENAVLILEPGRSIVGTAGVMICKVIGVKMGQEKNFIVTDGSMAELIRPSLYQAYHHIHFTEPVGGPEATFDIVGPVCESADFLGKDRKLPVPSEDTGVAIFDTGAYGMVMSSNYNGRMRPPEFIVDGNQLIQIRKGESLEDHLHLYEIKE